MSMRLKIGVIGLGQCGGNLANTFAKYGYPSMAVNTSIQDLKDLSYIPESRRIHIPLYGTDGAGKDPQLGEEAITTHQQSLLSAVEGMAQGQDALLLTAGLGGGTGSNIAHLGALLRRFSLPVIAMVTIPTDNEAALTKINALRSVNRLVGENFHSCIIVDNEKILSQFPESTLAAFYPQANEYVVKTFSSLNSVATEMSSRSIITFDNEDFRKVLLSHGILIFGETHVPVSSSDSLEALLPRMQQIWEGSGLMAEGFDFSTAAIGAVVFFAPRSVLERTSSKFLGHLGEEYKRLTDGATSYFGLYEIEDNSPVKIVSILGRLAIPGRLQSMLQAASDEGQNLSKKISQELPSLDLSGLESISLFSSAFAASSSHRSPRQDQYVAPITPAPYPSDSAGHPAAQGDANAPQDPFLPQDRDSMLRQASETASLEAESEEAAERRYSLEEYVRIKKTKGG